MGRNADILSKICEIIQRPGAVEKPLEANKNCCSLKINISGGIPLMLLWQGNMAAVVGLRTSHKMGDSGRH